MLGDAARVCKLSNDMQVITIWWASAQEYINSMAMGSRDQTEALSIMSWRVEGVARTVMEDKG
jgi:hypothetical protein